MFEKIKKFIALIVFMLSATKQIIRFRLDMHVFQRTLPIFL